VGVSTVTWSYTYHIDQGWMYFTYRQVGTVNDVGKQVQGVFDVCRLIVFTLLDVFSGISNYDGCIYVVVFFV